MAAGKIKTVEDLVEEVRSQLDEDNTATVSTDKDILPALNRAQDYSANILARHYESPLLGYTIVPMVAGQYEYDIPKDALEERIEKIEVKQNNLYYPLIRVNYRDIGSYETTVLTPIPSYYVVIGDKFRLVPGPTGTYDLRVWYLKDPMPLVLPQGRVTKIDNTNNYILVDTVGDNLTTETDNLNSYVNIVDGKSGVVKGAFQIKTIVDTKITFKTTPSRTSVYGSTILTSLADITVEEDDFVCVVAGNCVPFYKKPLYNFLVQYAVAEITRKLGGESDMEQRVLKELEAQVEHSWVGREQSLRVSMVNNKWAKLRRRFWR